MARALRWFPLATLIVLSCGSDEVTEPQWVEQAELRGLRFTHDHGGSGKRYFPETMGSGCGLFDGDGDGDLDVLLLDGAPLPGCPRGGFGARLFRNGGDGRFEDWGDGWHGANLGYNMGCAAGDVDRDGDVDLFLANYGPDILLINEDGRFRDRSALSGITDEGWSTSAAFADVDLDGDLDLYVAHYVEYALDDDHLCRNAEGQFEYCDPDSFPGQQDRLYLGRGDGTFVESSQACGVIVPEAGRGLGVVFLDHDEDGDPDLFVANDRTPNYLFVNDGSGKFDENGLIAGVAYAESGRVRAGMGTDAGDFNGDGRLDLVVVNFGNEPATLFANDGEGLFSDVTSRSGLLELTLSPLGFGTGFLDADLDGDLDLFVANGHVLDTIAEKGGGHTHAQANQLLLNDAGAFAAAPASSTPGLGVSLVSRGAAFGDIDNDGDVDVLVSNCNGRPELLVAEVPGRHFLGVALRGLDHRSPYGALVEVRQGERTWRRQVQAGRSYLSTSDPRVVFGLGERASPVEVSVIWPSGRRQSVGALEVDRYHTILESAE